MKVLMISLDRACLREGSPQREKLIRYGSVLDELHVIVFYFGERLPSRMKCAPNTFIYPTNHAFRCNPLYFYKAFRIGARIIRGRSFNSMRDVVTAQDPFPTGFVAYFLSRVFRIPFQLQIHIDFFNPFFLRESLWQRIYGLCARLLIRRADSIRVVSREIARYLEKDLGVNPRKLVILPVIPNMRFIASALPRFNLRLRCPQFSHIGLMACRLVPQKGVAWALYAMRILVRTHPHVGLVIVGSGPDERRLKKIARDMAPNAIIFVPWTEDVTSYYKGSDFFLLPSLYEGWGLTVVEAMAHSLPVVATPVGCVPELIDSGKNGYIIPHGDPAGIAEAMRAMCGDPVLLGKLAREAHDTVFRRFGRAAEEYPYAYKKALSHATCH